MLNLLYGYIENSLPEGVLTTAPGLRMKADENGRLLPFVGNTVVFLLDDSVKTQLSELQKELYRAAGQMLSEPLSPDTFHMTLHDLANGVPGGRTREWMAQTEPAARRVLEELRKGGGAAIPMKATWMFNMVNTSIVLGLSPVDVDGEARLGRMYEALNTVVPLNYALTPHITLAYFKPGSYSGTALEELRNALGPVELEVCLGPERLVLQRFTDMNHYFTI